MTFTLVIALWWIVPIVWTLFAISMAVATDEYKESFVIWLANMVIILSARFLP